MARTRRHTPQDDRKRTNEAEEQFERDVAQLRAKYAKVTPARTEPAPVAPPAQVKTPVPAATPGSGQVHVDALAAEAQKALASKADPSPTAYTRQRPAPGQEESGAGLVWWSGGNVDDYIPLAEYGTQQRQRDLRAFALVAPLVLIAESVLTKKMQALQWSVEAGRNKAIHWQNVLANLGQNEGWDTFIARWTRGYCESDPGGYSEIIRRAPRWAVDAEGNLTARGMEAVQSGADRAWAVVDSRVMDVCRCVPSVNPEFPLIYTNPYTGAKHRLREHQFMRIVDMPGTDDAKPGQGVCSVSRAVWAAQEDRMDVRYSFEALSENPGTGLIMANVNQTLLETALASAQGARDARGVVYYKGVIFLPILDPSGTTKLEYLTFSHYPEQFNRTEDYSRIKEIVASAFGLDVLEMGSIPGHNLGTSAQAEVGAAKARGKGIGALIQGVEREFRHKFLPADVQLRIKKHDIEEQKDRAELDSFYFQAAVSMVQVGAWDPVLANQYLADRGAIEPEFPYMAQDLTPSEELEDTEASERTVRKGTYEPRVVVYKDGRIHEAHPFVGYAQKQIRKKAVDLSVPEAIGMDDVSRARALVHKHLPQYAAMVDPSAIYVPQQRSLAQEERSGFLGAIQKTLETALQVRSERPQIVQVPAPQAPPTIHVHMPEQRDTVLKVDQPPPVVNVTVEPSRLPEMTFKMDASDMPAPVYHVNVPPTQMPDVYVNVDQPNVPDVLVNVEPSRPSDVTVKMDAPQMPIQIQAELHAADEVIETETIVERDAQNRITRTNKRSRKGQ